MDLLPGFNCGACGYGRCDEFARALIRGEADVDACPYLRTERFAEERRRLEELLSKGKVSERVSKVVGVIDGYEADLVLSPLPGEPSCREILHPFWSEAAEFEEGDVVRYRPWGCPITHFARVIDADKGLLTVHVVGPRHRLGESNFEYEDIGLCLVIGFEGVVSEGRVPEVGETVRFVPEHCMMQKVHSAVVVEAIGDRLRLESVDLKIWSPPHSQG